MSLYITVYVILAILLLLLINFRLINQKNSSKVRGKKNIKRVKEVHSNSGAKENLAKSEKEDIKIQENPSPDLSNQEVEMLRDSAITKPTLENAEADVQPKESLNRREKSTATDNEKVSGTGKILVAIMLGAFVAILNQTLLNVAIPHIMNDLGITANTVQWLSTGYMLVNGIAIPITAFLTEKLGTRKLFISAMSLFTLGSLVCSLSPNFSLLMTGRIIQGCGAGIIMPLLMTVFFTVFPPEKRGKAMGIMGTVIIFAPAIGPTLSGWLIGHYSWRFLFDIVIPFGVLDLILCFLWLKDVTKVTNPKFDFPGFIFSTLGFGFLLYGFSEAGNDGWTSTTVIISFAIGIISLAAFVWRELTVDKPMLDLRVFKYDIFTLTTIISMLVNMAMYGAMIMLPIYLQNIRGFTALQSGLLMLPGAVIMGIMSPISGALFDKIGSRWLAVIGLTITALTTWQFTTLSMTTSFSRIVFLYSMRSFGMSFIMMTIMTEGLNQLPRHLGSHGTAVSNTAKQVAGSIGTALLVTIMSTKQGVHYGEFTNTVTSTNPFISGNFSHIAQTLSGYAHLPPAAGRGLTTYLIYGQAMQQSTIDGINDTFIFATGIAIVGLILSFFIKRARVKE
ncbi:DHA2 family efflux MFS transporter permease subunit [Neobacillus massiliamazoniensis]|uniref:EmrB/QacA subfamily drug resistance transporter n=1 Tax=Neobacillus massiliamazoniensis TaxID=1499688 RepID=A0A0U1NZH0_9BACI|nr:DHA2 family efflux MFS transporter permease subunit [Neobacillus massiliamazoniensis]CRK83232.1 EmrB/QacA subfamily drug resistance transporter [Neobacillus massiliamazoniensis]